MQERGRLQEAKELAADLWFAALAIAGLVGWAAWKSAHVKALRLIGKRKQADRVEAKADREFRQLCGVPEPGEGWD